MLTAQRKQLIRTRLACEGQVVAKDLAVEVGTSEDTIRRDLRELAQAGKLQRVHGGALPASLAPNVAVAVAAHRHVDIIMLGGRLFRHSMVHVGATVIDAVSRMRADLYFMGATGVHPEAGLSTGDVEEAAVKRALHGCAAETVVLASSEKLMAASAFVIAALQELSALVVPAASAERTLRALRAGGVKVVRAA